MQLGLIAFDTVNAQVACAAGQKPRYRLLRVRTVIYGLMLAVVGTAMVVNYEQRQLVHVSILRDRAPLFVRLADGAILNAYTLKISNLTQTAQTYKISLEGIDGASMVRAGSDEIPEPQLHVAAAPDAVATFRVMVRVPVGPIIWVSRSA